MSPLSATSTATAPATAPAGRSHPAAKPRGNPNLHLAPAQPARGRPCPRAPVPGVASRGARARAGCPCQAPAIRGRLRCRRHGGRSTGPRTPESLPRRSRGLASIRAARTLHGRYGAKERALNRYRISLLCRTRVTVAVATRPSCPRNSSPACTTMPPSWSRRASPPAASPLPRIKCAAAPSPPPSPPGAGRSPTPARPRAPPASRPPPPAPPTRTRASVRTPQTATAQAGPPDAAGPSRRHSGRTPCTRARSRRARHLPDRTLCTISARRPRRPGAHARPGPAPRRLCRPGPRRTRNRTDRTPCTRARPDRVQCRRARTLCTISARRPRRRPVAHAPRDPHRRAHAVPARCAHTNPQPEPFAPEGAPGPRQTAAPEPYEPVPAEAAPVLSPGLPNRAARRRWLRQQRRLHRAPPAATRP